MDRALTGGRGDDGGIIDDKDREDETDCIQPKTSPPLLESSKISQETNDEQSLINIVMKKLAAEFRTKSFNELKQQALSATQVVNNNKGNATSDMHP